MTWTLKHKPAKGDGHRLFMNKLGQISVCDNSGDNPDMADDGPLIVDPGVTAEAIINWTQKWGGVYYHVPVFVKRQDSRRSLVSISSECMYALVNLVPVKVTLSKEVNEMQKALNFAQQLARGG
jgi:hypothetical protein